MDNTSPIDAKDILILISDVNRSGLVILRRTLLAARSNVFLITLPALILNGSLLTSENPHLFPN